VVCIEVTGIDGSEEVRLARAVSEMEDENDELLRIVRSAD
jgi:hypothetical protein